MNRLVYRSLIRLHPGAFRQRFGAEMMYIFDQTALTGTTAALLADAVISLARQWLLRTGSWKAVAALLGAMLQVAAGGLGLPSTRRLHAIHTTAPAAPSEVIQLILMTAVSLVVIILATALWVRHFVRQIARS